VSRKPYAVLLLAVLVTGAAGCGKAGKSTGTWADQVCGVLAPWQQDQSTALASATTKTGTAEPTQVRDRLSQALGAIVTSTGGAADHVQSIGAPDVPSGRAAKGELVATLRRTGQSFADLKTQIDGLDVRDQGAFAKALSPIAQQLSTASNATQDTFQRLNGGDIGKAFANSAACKGLLQSGPAG
jgi:hypothetical protein